MADFVKKGQVDLMNTYETKKNADEIDSLDKHLINPRLPFKKAKDILGK
jgi:hypothetical protein